jgi:phosphoribosyl-ATP pyrophosphohydrolase
MGRRLVRDRALENWVVPGAEEQVRRVTGRREHLELLRCKVLEEAAELAMAAEDEGNKKPYIDLLMAEGTDLIEAVFSYLERATHKKPHEVVALVMARREENGGFLEGLVWDTTR